MFWMQLPPIPLIVAMHCSRDVNEQLTTLSRLAIYRSVGGSVKASAGPIDCGEACTEELPTGTIRSLTALAGSGFRFSHWEGACTGAAPACSVTVSGDMQASAFFAPARTLTVQRDGREVPVEVEVTDIGRKG